MRASVSLPAIFPPAIEQGDLLIDGALLNNLPVDVMKELMPGKTIAVDLSVDDEYRVEEETMPSVLEYLKSKLLPYQQPIEVPTLNRVVIKATTLGSRREVEAAKKTADLYLNPPVGGFDLLGWDRFHEIVELGYRYGKDKIRPWIEQDRSVVQPDELFDSRFEREQA